MARNHTPQDLDTALDEAAAGRRVILRRGGRRFAIITGDDLARLEEAEAEEDADLQAAALAAEAEAKANGEVAVPFDEARRRLGV
ncbi:MAG: type II toxin-antitoxin system Phd/YefM family antitoxin [Armatimonadetes bacterium]|nr:type II toxin-antitoxin system Phd/YefM family antitoxin [Armatimonadota bacterium]